MKRPPPLASWLQNQALSSPMRESVLHLVASSHWDEPRNPEYTLGVGAVRPVGVSKLAETWNSNISCS